MVHVAWFKVDDGFASSKPVLRIPRRYRLAGVGLWLMAGTWSAQEELDGFVPEYVLEELCGTYATAAHLVSAGLWTKVEASSSVSGLPGWQFRNWSRYQPTRQQLEEVREKERLRKANYRMSHRDTDGTDAGHPVGHHPESGHPDPTRPDPTPSTDTSTSGGHEKPTYSSEFQGWWELYPRKESKGAASKEFERARKDVDLETLTAATQRYALLHAGEDRQFVKLPAGWLSDRKWEDEETTTQPAASHECWRDGHKFAGDGYCLLCGIAETAGF